MPLDPPAFVFTDEKTGAELRLHGADLPEPPSDWGGSMRETVTNYPGGEKSVQIHGPEFTPLTLQGRWEDGWTETPGWAQSQKKNAQAIWLAGNIVRVDYGDESRWGTFHCEIREHTRTDVRYEIEFRPYWLSPPEYEAIANFDPTPGEDASKIDESLKRLEAEAEGTPGYEMKPSWELEMNTRTQRALNSWGGVGDSLGGVGAYSEMTERTLKQVQRRTLGTLDATLDMTRRIEGASPSEMAVAGPARLVAQDWSMQLERRARLASSQLLEFIRNLARVRRPDTQREYVVREGDTLVRIAQEQLGDWERWEDIANANDLTFPSQISVGDVLVIPVRS